MSSETHSVDDGCDESLVLVTSDEVWGKGHALFPLIDGTGETHIERLRCFERKFSQFTRIFFPHRENRIVVVHGFEYYYSKKALPSSVSSTRHRWEELKDRRSRFIVNLKNIEDLFL